LLPAISGAGSVVSVSAIDVLIPHHCSVPERGSAASSASF
jgi:hypothetical protein